MENELWLPAKVHFVRGVTVFLSEYARSCAYQVKASTLHPRVTVKKIEGLYTESLMRIKTPLKATVLWSGVVFLCVAPAFGYEVENEIESKTSLAALVSFTKLTKDLNHLSEHSRISFRIQELGQASVLVSRPQLPLSQGTKNGKAVLPEISTDTTKINPIDLEAFGIGNLSQLSETKEASANSGLLPIPQARVVAPVGEQRDSRATEAPLKTQEALNNPDVITGLTPKTTRFGKDRYDSSLFGEIKPVAPSNFKSTEAPQPVASADKPADLMNPLAGSNSDQEQDPEKRKEQEARQSFQKTMKEFAERTEEKEAFRLVDYYDLKNVLTKHEGLLSSFEDDEFDERFVRNAQIIFDRFGDKDASEDKKPFQRFIKRMQPEEAVFRSQDLRKSAFPSNRTHREQTPQSSQ